MKIKWLGHACFLVTTSTGVKIITDPYKAGGAITYGEINESADVVLVSHEHFDHSNTDAVKGRPVVIKGPGTQEAKGLKFKGIASFHDEAGGTKRGNNTIFVFEVDGLRLCHLGDLGHALSSRDLADIGKVDVLFIPVGGLYTCEPTDSVDVMVKLSPAVTIPMHFRTAGIDTGKFGSICGVDEFTKGQRGVRQLEESEIELKAGELPPSPRIIVLKPAL